MEYSVRFSKAERDGFRSIRTARRFAYANISRGKAEIIRISNYGNEYICGYVNGLGNTVFYREWPSETEWVLKKDGTLGEKYRW